jgi:HTH-type transcriptional regulator / antitoxin HipB
MPTAIRPVRNDGELGESIRAERLKQGLRQVDLARKASVRQALVSELENGVTNARMETVFKVLAALDLDLAIVARHKAAFDPTAY